MSSETNWKGRVVRIGDARFLFPNPLEFSMCPATVESLEETFQGATLLKDTPNVRAAIVKLEGREVFLKRIIFPRIPLRYLFRHARVFRMERFAELIRNAGIPTPRMLAAGELRKGLRLLRAWLVEEAVRDAEPVRDLFLRPDAAARIAIYIEDCGRVAAAFHRAKLYHGDLNQSNLHYRGAVLSVWDLDTVRYCRRGVPKRLIVRELTRIAVEICAAALHSGQDQLKPFANFRAVAGKLMESYIEVAPDALPALEELLESMRRRWARKYGELPPFVDAER